MGKITKMNYTAVICAAGQGKRLGESTDTLPKTLVKVGGKAILEHLLSTLSSCGLKNVLIVVGYKGQDIELAIGNSYKDCAINYIYNNDFETTDNFYSLFLTREKITGPMIFFNADIIFSKDILRQIITDGNDNSLAVASVNSPGAGKNPVRIQSNGRDNLIAIGHDIGEDKKQMVFGIYKLSTSTTKEYFKLAKEYFKDGPRKGGFWWPIQQMAPVVPFHALKVSNQKWISINTMEEYKNAERLVRNILD